MRILKRIPLLIVLIFVTTLTGNSQIKTSVINGKVINLEGLPVAGVKVVAAHVPSGTLYAAISDADGKYRLPDVEVGGPYSVNANQPGFKPFSRENIYLNLGQTYDIDILLNKKAAKGDVKNNGKCLVVLSMDGFRWDYPTIYHTPNLNRLATLGCKAESLKPSYPTKTFPNHYAIATGLYPDHNGIVQNSFYDPRIDRSFRMGDRQAVQDSVFWEGEAIWETAESQGVKTASYFWVGTESNKHYRPEIRKLYEDGFPYNQQIDTVFKWLAMPAEERPGLIMFYFDEPDKTSHDFGPVSTETGEVVKKLDRLIGVIVSGLKRIEKREGIDIDLIVLSDHGMGYIPEGNEVFLEDIIDLKKVTRINGGCPVINLDPQPGYLEEAYRKLKSTPHLKVWRRAELPERYHYGTHPRIPELIVEADSAWGVEVRHKAQGAGNKVGQKAEGRGQKGLYSLGMHGYDPDNKDMHGIFYAEGPSFKKGYVQPAFENVNIYELLAKLLGIKPAKTDGELTKVNGMLNGN